MPNDVEDHIDLMAKDAGLPPVHKGGKHVVVSVMRGDVRLHCDPTPLRRAERRDFVTKWANNCTRYAEGLGDVLRSNRGFPPPEARHEGKISHRGAMAPCGSYMQNIMSFAGTLDVSRNLSVMLDILPIA